MRSRCLELEERRRVEETRVQSKCLELEEERRRVEGTRMQSNCLKLEEWKSLGIQDAEQLLRVKRRAKKS